MNYYVCEFIKPKKKKNCKFSWDELIIILVILYIDFSISIKALGNFSDLDLTSEMVKAEKYTSV